jgi:hypothetical protein
MTEADPDPIGPGGTVWQLARKIREVRSEAWNSAGSLAA